MSVRACPYRVVAVPEAAPVDPRTGHGFLGIRYVFHDGAAEIDSILPNTPAEAIDLHPGDRVLAIDGVPVRSTNDLQERIWTAHPGAQPSLTIDRAGTTEQVRPTLVAWPSNISYSY